MRFFAVSDIHGFYNEFIYNLNEAGFVPEKDCLISCGDAMDRGPQPRQVIDYLVNLPNKILVRGNHEILLEEALSRRFFQSHDFSNGTADTIYDFSMNPLSFTLSQAQACGEMNDDSLFNSYRNLLVNYYETTHYIFVHSFIPLGDDGGSKDEDDWDSFNWYSSDHNNAFYLPSWRKVPDYMWEDAMWGNPFLLSKYNETGKTIVFGHFHTSYYHNKIAKTCHKEFSKTKELVDFSPAYYEKYHTIGIDACTAYSHKVNILVLEDELII